MISTKQITKLCGQNVQFLTTHEVTVSL